MARPCNVFSYRIIIFLISLGVALLALPLLVQGYWLHLVGEILILALFATSLNFIVGLTGMISFGQAGFYGIGLYMVAIMLKGTSLPFFLILIIASLSAAVAGLIVGLLSVRHHGFYFAILTLAFGQLIWAVVFKWRKVTGERMA